MQKVKTYDLPLRIFHWLFAILFVTSFVIAKFIDDESALYAYHMISGMLMMILVIMRIVWSFLGEKTSKFGSYKLKIQDLIQYLKSVLSGHSKRYLGHNPASSYAAVLMFVFTTLLVTTGFFMIFRINKHFFEEVHELLAHAFLIIVILHIGGVWIHQLFHQDGMIFAMFSGRKNAVENEAAISSFRTRPAIVFLSIFSLSAIYLNTNFNARTGVLSIMGKDLQLGEVEGNEMDHEKEWHNGFEEEDDD
ncbi:MAG: hypothetical protein OHK0056_31650 [Bacteriovoracaceae bacterium]